MQRYTEEDPILVQLALDVLKGRLRTEQLTKTKYKQVFKEISYVDKVLLKGDKILIPTKLRPDLLVWHMRDIQVPILQQLREDVWWSWKTVDLEEFVSTCSVGCGSAVARDDSGSGGIRLRSLTCPNPGWRRRSKLSSCTNLHTGHAYVPRHRL